jgi:hypothetical protein
MQNIAFNYLYRDAANYKNFGTVVFSNPGKQTPEQLTALLIPLLFDGEFFDCRLWQVPDKSPMGDFGFKWDDTIDHTFHEFESFEYTPNPVTDARSVQQFIKQAVNSL